MATTIETTGSVAEHPAESTRTMTVASDRAAKNMASTSQAFEANALAANEMRLTTGHVAGVIVPIAGTASQNAATAQTAAVAVSELSRGIAVIDATAESMRAEVTELAGLIAKFTFRESAVAATEPRAAAMRLNTRC